MVPKRARVCFNIRKSQNFNSLQSFLLLAVSDQNLNWSTNLQCNIFKWPYRRVHFFRIRWSRIHQFYGHQLNYTVWSVHCLKSQYSCWICNALPNYEWRLINRASLPHLAPQSYYCTLWSQMNCKKHECMHNGMGIILPHMHTLWTYSVEEEIGQLMERLQICLKEKKTAVNVTIKSNELLQRCKCRQHVYDVQNHFYCKIYRTDREKDWKGDCDRVDGDRVDSVCTSEIRVLHGDLVSPHKD